MLGLTRVESWSGLLVIVPCLIIPRFYGRLYWKGGSDNA